MKTKFPHYKVSKQERELVEEFESHTHFDLMNPEEVKDIETFRRCLEENMAWFLAHVNETMNMLQRDIHDWHRDATSRTSKITRLLK